MMGGSTESQKHDQSVRREILKGILDEVEPRVSFLTAAGALRFDVERSYPEFIDAMADVPENGYIGISTFSWDGQRGSKPMIFSTQVRKESIMEYSEVTEDMWTQYITSAADRAMQASAVAVPGGVVPRGGMN